MKNISKKITLAVFLGFIGLLGLWGVVLPDRDFSSRENRYLQTLPSLTAERLFNGSFTREFEDYCADQFPLRDIWITLNARYESSIGKSETNGFYLCDGERLLEPFASPDEIALRQRGQTVGQFAASVAVPVTLGLIPGSSELYSALLPQGAPNDSQRQAIEAVYAAAGVATADILGALEPHTDEYIFYRTDHHWTSLGAYYGYTALCDAWGLTPHALDSFAPVTVSTDFYGTAYSSSGFTWIAPDSIERFADEPAALSVFNFSHGSAEAGLLYHPEQLNKKDQYTYFMGGNTPCIVLEQEASSLPSLLILRDSFSDCLTPFLLEHFGSVHLLDLRYYLGDVREYIAENKIDQVLILYSVPNFCTEKSVLSLGA